VLDARQLIEVLHLEPHPEGGWFRETWRAPSPAGDRAAGTSIYYLLQAGERSHWHRFDATEVWHFYAGDSLRLVLSADGVSVEERVLGLDVRAGQRPQLVVPAGVWQTAWPLGQWTLAGCTVTPGFEFAGFELAPRGWEPGA
jgi:predicted cupin superfamily sugar epimerase